MDKIEGLKLIELLNEKKNDLTQAHIKASDAAQRFSLKKELEEIEGQIEKYKKQTDFSKSVMILLVSADRKSIQKHIQSEKDKNEIEELYGEKEFDWIMYREEDKKYSFINLLIEFQTKSKTQLKICMVDESEFSQLTALGSQKENVIVIIDCLALHFIPNYKSDICAEVNHITIGGCLIPICENLPLQAKQYMRKAREQRFRKICGHTKNDFNVSLFHIELELPTKNDFHRRLSNIIFGNNLIKEQVRNHYDNESSKVLQNSKIVL